MYTITSVNITEFFAYNVHYKHNKTQFLQANTVN